MTRGACPGDEIIDQTPAGRGQPGTLRWGTPEEAPAPAAPRRPTASRPARRPGAVRTSVNGSRPQPIAAVLLLEPR